MRKGEAALRARRLSTGDVKILTSCPSCLQGLSRYNDDCERLLEADYIVVEMANHILGENWMPDYVASAPTTAASSACWSEWAPLWPGRFAPLRQSG